MAWGQLPPDDEHNKRLLEQVHPPDWQNPTPALRYHLVVVGAGTAGLVCAAGAAGLGARVALVERHLMGGDCLNVGCVPSKGLIRAARAWHAARTGDVFGAPVADGAGDFAAVMERMRRLRADISPVDGAARFRDLGVDVFLGEGRFVAEDALEVDGQRLHFRRAVVATGGRAALPLIGGLAESRPLTNETVFSLTRLPASLVVIGGGPIGCELAQTFARFGCQVTLLQHSERLLPRDDADASALVERSLVRDGVRVETSAEAHRVDTDGSGFRVHYRGRDRDPGRSDEEGSVVAGRILVAAGRRPNVEGLGLEAAGVEFGRRGVVVDDRLRSTNKRIFAAGDVAGNYQFTHAADAMARIVIRNALFPFGRAKVSDLVMPWCTYTSPEVAHTGLSPEQAREQGHAVETLTIDLGDNDRAILDGATEGFLRVHHRRGKDEILGATMVGEHAGDVISELTLAIRNQVGLAAIAGTIHPYPTQAEVVKRAGDAWFRQKLTPSKKAWLAKYFDWLL